LPFELESRPILIFNPLQAKVLLYLPAVEPAMNGMFKLLNEPVLTVDQLRQRARNKENSILELQSRLANSNLAQDRDTAELLEQLVRDALLDRSRAAIEESIRSGNEGKTLVDSSVSAGIILLAHHCIELAGAALKNGGRQIVHSYVLKDFLSTRGITPCIFSTRSHIRRSKPSRKLFSTTTHRLKVRSKIVPPNVYRSSAGNPGTIYTTIFAHSCYEI
jgi:hypothetical protein